MEPIKISVDATLTWMDIITLSLATYASVLSTVVGLIEVLRYRREIRNKLAITFAIQHRIVYAGGMVGGDWFKVFNLNVVNHSSTTKYIEQPYLQVDNSKKFLSAIKLDPPTYYPVTVESGQRWTTTLDFEEIAKKLNEVNCNKVRVIVSDTLGKDFKSNWIKLKDINESLAKR